MSSQKFIEPVALDQLLKKPHQFFQNRAAPKFGHEFLPYYSFNKGFLNLNNGEAYNKLVVIVV